jgi:acyl-homoserine lactone acylase PvdQ
LLAWDFSVDADSAAAGLYEMWQRRMSANVRDLVVPKEAQLFVGQLSMKRVIDWLNAPDGRFGADPVRGRDELLVRSLTEWDNSLGLNNPGQSGNPASPHYRDLFELWARGQYFPIFFSRSKIESVTEEKLTLVPR